ncbi:MAG: 50S ribosomal protein L35 [Armatimonadetes bacterium]|nr:50S ribosomal protein L35 [Armatimonadota bacterium]
MPKIRTRRAVAKRIKITATGKVKRMREFSGCHHIREKKSPKRTRLFRKPALAADGDARNLKRLAPYAK